MRKAGLHGVGVAALCVAFAASAMAQSNTRLPADGLPVPPPNEVGAASANDPGAISGGAPNGSDLSATDRAFVQQATQLAQAEIAAGRLALEASRTDKVLIFAHQAIETGEASLAPIDKIANSLGMRPGDRNAKAEAELGQLKAAEGTVFDGLYGDLEARDEQAMMALCTQEADHGDNVRLKSYAAAERQHVDVMLRDANLLKAGTINHANPNCDPNGPAKFGCP